MARQISLLMESTTNTLFTKLKLMYESILNHNLKKDSVCPFHNYLMLLKEMNFSSTLFLFHT